MSLVMFSAMMLSTSLCLWVGPVEGHGKDIGGEAGRLMS